MDNSQQLLGRFVCDVRFIFIGIAIQYSDTALTVVAGCGRYATYVGLPNVNFEF